MSIGTLVASSSGFSKHDIAGVVLIVVALALVVGGIRLAARVAMTVTFLVAAAVIAVVAVLLFTRAI